MRLWAIYWPRLAPEPVLLWRGTDPVESYVEICGILGGLGWNFAPA